MSVEAPKFSEMNSSSLMDSSLQDVNNLNFNNQYRSLGYGIPQKTDTEQFEPVEFISDRIIIAGALSNSQLFQKRILDIFGAIFGLLIFSVPMLFIAVLIKLGSKGPIFYGQERVGYKGRSFKMWKFRSMRTDAEMSTGAVWAIENDPRRTKLGVLLRKSSLDEIPQFWNVLMGEMSLVGPRPERPHFVKEFSREIPDYQSRHSAPVGITGLAQVYGWRGNTSLEKRIEFDLKYIKNWSLLSDIKILFLTVFRGFINKNAY